MGAKRKGEPKAEAAIGKRKQAKLDKERQLAEELAKKREEELSSKIEVPPPKSIRELWNKCEKDKD
eukprot:1001075-Pyramimonas_sp.AAC.1